MDGLACMYRAGQPVLNLACQISQHTLPAYRSVLPHCRSELTLFNNQLGKLLTEFDGICTSSSGFETFTIGYTKDLMG